MDSRVYALYTWAYKAFIVSADAAEREDKLLENTELDDFPVEDDLDDLGNDSCDWELGDNDFHLVTAFSKYVPIPFPGGR